MSLPVGTQASSSQMMGSTCKAALAVFCEYDAQLGAAELRRAPPPRAAHPPARATLVHPAWPPAAHAARPPASGVHPAWPPERPCGFFKLRCARKSRAGDSIKAAPATTRCACSARCRC